MREIVVLVHGTFARDADWTAADSPLGKTVASALPASARVVAFPWSGSNSHSARLRAGGELAEHLSELAACDPDLVFHLIAHSHGGNVVSYALRDARLAGRVASAVCLGTPFVIAKPREIGETLRFVRALLILLLPILGVFVWMPASLLMGESSWAVGLSFLMTAALYAAFRWLLKSWLPPKLLSYQIRTLHALRSGFASVPVLNVQVEADEAGWWLRIVHRLAEEPFKLWQPVRLTKAMYFGAGFSIFMVLIATNSDGADMDIGTAIGGAMIVAGMWLLLVAVATVAAQVSCVLWPMFFKAHVLGFGRDGFMKNWLVAISAGAVPADSAAVRTELVTIQGFGLRHSRLYEDPVVLGLIRSWITLLASPESVNQAREPVAAPERRKTQVSKVEWALEIALAGPLPIALLLIVGVWVAIMSLTGEHRLTVLGLLVLALPFVLVRFLSRWVFFRNLVGGGPIYERPLMQLLRIAVLALLSLAAAASGWVVLFGWSLGLEGLKSLS